MFGHQSSQLRPFSIGLVAFLMLVFNMLTVRVLEETLLVKKFLGLVWYEKENNSAFPKECYHLSDKKGL